MKNRRNYYRILHVQPDAPLEIIKSSYRALMLNLEMHPDRGGDHWNAALINEAYAVVSDPASRQAYDRQLAAARGSARHAPPSSRATPAGGPAAELDCCVFCQAPYRAAVGDGPDARCPTCRSPLAPAAELDLARSGRRAVGRVAREREIVFFTDWPQQRGHRGRVRDFSPLGMQFVAGVLLRQYQIIKIDGAELSATARVAHCVPAPRERERYVVGAEFFTVRFEELRGTFLSVEG